MGGARLQRLVSTPKDVAGYHPRLRLTGAIALMDSTGIKAESEGEWHACKHGGPKRRLWRKIHLGIDEQTLEVRAIEVTGSHIGDAPMLPDLLGQIAPNQVAYKSNKRPFATSWFSIPGCLGRRALTGQHDFALNPVATARGSAHAGAIFPQFQPSVRRSSLLRGPSSRQDEVHGDPTRVRHYSHQLCQVGRPCPATASSVFRDRAVPGTCGWTRQLMFCDQRLTET